MTGFGGRKLDSILFAATNFSRSFKVIWVQINSVRPILFGFGREKGGVVLFLLINFSRSFKVIWGQTRSVRPISIGFGGEKGVWCVLFAD